jgi:hypothetical protein
MFILLIVVMVVYTLVKIHGAVPLTVTYVTVMNFSSTGRNL